MSATAGAPPPAGAPAGPTLAYAGVIASVTFWGLNVVLLKWLVGYLPVDAINVVRLTLSGLLLVGTMRLLGPWPRLSPRTLAGLGLAGLMGTTVFQMTYLAGIRLSPAGLASLVNATSPVSIALLGALLGERLGARRWLGIGLSLAGVSLLALKTLDPTSGLTAAGLGLLLAASLAWAAYTMLARPFLMVLNPLQFTALSVAMGSVPYVVLRAPVLLDPAVTAAGPAVWLGVAASAVFANYLAFLGWMAGVRALGPTRVGIVQNLAPLVGILGGYVALGEGITPLAAASAVVTLAGVYLASRPDRPGAADRVGRAHGATLRP